MLIVIVAITYKLLEKQEPKSINIMKELIDEIYTSIKLKGEKREKGVKEGTKVMQCFSYRTRIDKMAALGYILYTRCRQIERS